MVFIWVFKIIFFIYKFKIEFWAIFRWFIFPLKSYICCSLLAALRPSEVLGKYGTLNVGMQIELKSPEYGSLSA